MEKKIILEEILDNIMIGSGWSLSDSLIKEVIIPAMKEACIQTNKLDAENAKLYYNEELIDFKIDKNSILRTLDQIN